MLDLMVSLFVVIWPRPDTPSSESLAVLQVELLLLRDVASIAGQQRCATTRTKYKRPCGVNPTIFVNLSLSAERDDPAHLLTSFTAELDRLIQSMHRGGVAAGSGAALGVGIQVDANFSRDEYGLLSGDIAFIKGGEIVVARQGDQPERVIADGEDFWALQVREAVPWARMRAACSVKLLWLNRIGGSEQHRHRSSNWRLLPNSAGSIRFSRLLAEDGEPIVVRRETLQTGWDAANGTVFTFSEALVEQLIELAEVWGEPAAAVRQPTSAATDHSGPENNRDSSDDEEPWDERVHAQAEMQPLGRVALLDAVCQGMPQQLVRRSARLT